MSAALRRAVPPALLAAGLLASAMAPAGAPLGAGAPVPPVALTGR